VEFEEPQWTKSPMHEAEEEEEELKNFKLSCYNIHNQF
jgi:hypothetical protein